MDWLENEYNRLVKQGCLDNSKDFNYLNEVVLINGNKILKRNDIKVHFESSDFKIEESKNILGIGKDFLEEFNKTDIWSN